MPAVKKKQSATKAAPKSVRAKAKRRDETRAPEQLGLFDRIERYRSRYPRLSRGLIMGAGLLVVAGIGYGADRLGYTQTVSNFAAQASDNVARAAGFTVADVSVVGRERTGRAELLSAIGVVRDQSILPFDVAGAKARVESLPWVHQAVVTRLLPDTIHVKLYERVPYALWQNKGIIQVIDQQGAVIEGAPIGRYAQLPLVVGPTANDFAREILTIVSTSPALEDQVRSAIRVGKRRWDVELANGIRVALPEVEAGKAWTYLGQLDSEHNILSRDIQSIDLRLPDRLVVRTHDNAAGFRLLVDEGEDT